MMIPPSSVHLSGNIQPRNPKDKSASEEKGVRFRAGVELYSSAEFSKK